MLADILLPGLFTHISLALLLCTTYLLCLFEKTSTQFHPLYWTIVNMSDSIKRNANGAVAELEDEPWPTHPSKQPYKHSADSENKRTDVNASDP